MKPRTFRRENDSVQDFLNEAGKIPLLTHDEEIILGRKVQAMQRLLEECPDGPYDFDQQRVIRLGKRAKERMVTANLRLVVSVAKRYIRAVRHMELADLIQEGMFGLIRGIEKFDPERGYKASTYLYWWIRQGVNRAISQQDRIIRLPFNGIDCISKLRTWVPEFRRQHGRTPSAEECAAYCNTSIHTMRHYLAHIESAVSLDLRCGDDDSSHLLDLVVGLEDAPLDVMETQDGLERLNGWINHLSDREQEVLAMRFGMNGHSPSTLVEVGQRMKFTREAARQNERKALLKLRLIAGAT